MTLYLYKIGTEKPVLTVKRKRAELRRTSVTAADGTLYEALAENYELCPARRIVGDSASRLPRGASHRKPV